MPSSSRLFQCQRCQAQVIVCRRCDRGQRYCAQGCAEKARTQSLKRAAKKYQTGRVGRFNNAERQRRFRARQREKVTHQGSIKIPRCAVLRTHPNGPEMRPIPAPTAHAVICHYCGGTFEPYLRSDFLVTGRFHRPTKPR